MKEWSSKAIIEKLELKPHPEGGHYKQVFKDSINVTVDNSFYTTGRQLKITDSINTKNYFIGTLSVYNDKNGYIEINNIK